jgi:hypothetical protein
MLHTHTHMPYVADWAGEGFLTSVYPLVNVVFSLQRQHLKSFFQLCAYFFVYISTQVPPPTTFKKLYLRYNIHTIY